MEMNMSTEMRKRPGYKGKSWAIASLILGILADLFGLGFVWSLFTRFMWMDTLIIFPALFLAAPFGLFSLVTGIVALFLIKKKATGKWDVWMAVAGILLGILGTGISPMLLSL